MTSTTALFQDPAFWAAVLTISTPLVFGVMGALLCARAGELDFGIAGIFLIGALIGLVLTQHGVEPWMALLAAIGAGMGFGLLQGILTGPLGMSQPLAGELDFGIAGIFLIGALIGLVLTQHGVEPWMALLAAIGAGMGFGLLQGMLTGPLGMPQPLAGVALTLLGLGIAKAGWPAGPATAAVFRPFDVPYLTGLPYVGEIFARQTPLDFAAVLTALVIAYVLNRTPLGLAIRACGDNPFAVEVQGRSVHGLRLGAIMAGSAIMAVGGAAIALTAPNLAVIDNVSGRGFLCLALAAAAGWRPGIAFAAALLFGAIDAAAPHLQQDFNVRAPIMTMLPYLLAIIALAATRRRLRWPAALAAPYIKGRAS